MIIFLLEEAAKCFLSLIAPCSEGEDKHTLVCSWTSVVEDSIDGLGNTPWDCSPGAGTLNRTSFWISLENHLGLQRPSSDISLCRRDETVPDCDIFSRDFYLLAHSSVIWEASCFGKEMIKWLWRSHSLRTWSQRCHSLFTKLVFKACAGKLIAQVPGAASPQHQLVLAGRSWPDFGCQQGWGCCPPPWVCREKENGIRSCPSFGDGQSSLTCRFRGLSCAPQFVECIHLILVRGSLHHSVLHGGVCGGFPAGSCLASAAQRGHMPGPFSPAPATGGESHPVPASSHAASRGTPRRFTLQKSKQQGKVSINIYFFTVHYLTLASFSPVIAPTH